MLIRVSSMSSQTNFIFLKKYRSSRCSFWRKYPFSKYSSDGNICSASDGNISTVGFSLTEISPLHVFSVTEICLRRIFPKAEIGLSKCFALTEICLWRRCFICTRANISLKVPWRSVHPRTDPATFWLTLSVPSSIRCDYLSLWHSHTYSIHPGIFRPPLFRNGRFVTSDMFFPSSIFPVTSRQPFNAQNIDFVSHSSWIHLWYPTGC